MVFFYGWGGWDGYSLMCNKVVPLEGPQTRHTLLHKENIKKVGGKTGGVGGTLRFCFSLCNHLPSVHDLALAILFKRPPVRTVKFKMQYTGSEWG